MPDLSGRVAVVTGAGSGIGRGIAATLAAAGASVLVVDRDPAGATATVDAITARGHLARSCVADVRDRAAMAAMAATADHDLGGLDICVANAGIAHGGSLLTMTDAPWHDMLDVNLTGLFLTVQACARTMVRRNRGGRIIVVASLAADRAYAGLFAYCATKAGARLMTRCWAQELAPYDITVNSIDPAWIETPMNAATIGQGEARAAFERAIPLGRVGTPADVGALACWLASDAAAYITGAAHLIDGGLADRDDLLIGAAGVAARNAAIRAHRAALDGDTLLALLDQPTDNT